MRNRVVTEGRAGGFLAAKRPDMVVILYIEGFWNKMGHAAHRIRLRMCLYRIFRIKLNRAAPPALRPSAETKPDGWGALLGLQFPVRALYIQVAHR